MVSGRGSPFESVDLVPAKVELDAWASVIPRRGGLQLGEDGRDALIQFWRFTPKPCSKVRAARYLRGSKSQSVWVVPRAKLNARPVRPRGPVERAKELATS
jgi:hypothetical protein